MKSLLISKDDLSLSGSNVLTAEQLQFILAKTPEKFIKKRPAKGGGEWKYIEVAYVIKVLNLMFGWEWDFEVLDEQVNIEAREVVVKGRLTVRSSGKTITKTQFGNKDIVFRKETKIPLSIGNDLKSAASDALKKCASLLGIAQDIYSTLENKEVVIEEANRDIAEMLCRVESIDDWNMLWGLLDLKDQEKYHKIFTIVRNGL